MCSRRQWRGGGSAASRIQKALRTRSVRAADVLAQAGRGSGGEYQSLYPRPRQRRPEVRPFGATPKGSPLDTFGEYYSLMRGGRRGQRASDGRGGARSWKRSFSEADRRRAVGSGTMAEPYPLPRTKASTPRAAYAA